FAGLPNFPSFSDHNGRSNRRSSPFLRLRWQLPLSDDRERSRQLLQPSRSCDWRAYRRRSRDGSSEGLRLLRVRRRARRTERHLPVQRSGFQRKIAESEYGQSLDVTMHPLHNQIVSIYFALCM
ncbi:hypothetical protein PRIPAC_75119, partial [Pristionchus pacificus]